MNEREERIRNSKCRKERNFRAEINNEFVRGKRKKERKKERKKK